MYPSRIRRMTHLAWMVFISALLLISYLFSVTKALASPDLGVVSNPPEGSFVITNRIFHLNPQDPTRVDAVEFNIAGDLNASALRVRLDSDGAWYDCRVILSKGRAVATCNTAQSVPLMVADMDHFQMAVKR